MGDFIDIPDLPENLQHRNAPLSSDEEWRPLSLDDVRKVHIQKVLQMCNGNRLRAAQISESAAPACTVTSKRDGCEIKPHAHTSGAAA